MDLLRPSGNPPVLSNIRPDLGARLVKWIHQDMERAKQARQQKKTPPKR